jgi:hypothetical protein
MAGAPSQSGQFGEQLKKDVMSIVAIGKELERIDPDAANDVKQALSLFARAISKVQAKAGGGPAAPPGGVPPPGPQQGMMTPEAT